MEADHVFLNCGQRSGVAIRSLTMLVLCAFGVTLKAEETNPNPHPKPPGVVIDHRAASTRQYVGSPSLAILADGDYVASHDWFGPGSTQNRTAVFASRDHGQTW